MKLRCNYLSVGTEIERKFLIKQDLFTPSSEGTMLEQGYLAEDPTVRVRLVSNTSARLTIKGRGTLVRPEFEYPIPYDEGVELMRMAKGKLTKIRFVEVFDGQTWEIDQFLGPLRGLWLAEIELTSPTATFTTPPWLDREVTEDVRYTNQQLVVYGIPV